MHNVHQYRSCVSYFSCVPLFLLFCVSILVGAPKDNITDSDAPSVVRNFVRPGVVYQCPLTASSRDCTDIKIDRECKFCFCFLFNVFFKLHYVTWYLVCQYVSISLLATGSLLYYARLIMVRGIKRCFQLCDHHSVCPQCWEYT